MKKLLSLMILTLAFGSAIVAQQSSRHDTKTPTGEPKDAEKARATKAPVSKIKTDADGVLRRGERIGTAKKVSLSEVLEKPEKFAGETLAVEGVIVRSCKMEGCWMELAPTKDAKPVRVTFKDHAFFIPFDSAGMSARAEGVFTVKTLSKKEVEHLVKEDGAKFDKINEDGTVTEVAFEAVGVELSKQTK